MAVESSAKFVFDGDASGVERAYDTMTEGTKAFSRASIEGMTQAAKSIKLVTEQLMENNVATKQLIDQKEALRKKLEEVKAQNQSLGKSFESVKSGFSGIVTAVAGSEIVKYILEIAEAQEKWNKEITRTQVEFDKVGRKLQVQSLMKDEQFKDVLDKEIAPLQAKYKTVSLEDVTEIYTALRSQGVDDKNLKNVAAQVIEGGSAIPGMKGSEMADFGIAMVRELQQKGMSAGDIGEKEMRGAILPAVNIAGKMRMRSGSEFMALQQSMGGLAESFNLNPEELTAEMAALGPHIGTDVAQKGMKTILARLMGEQGQKAMGENVSKVFNEQIAQGSVIGAFSALGDSLNQLPEDQRQKKMAELFPARQQVVGRALLQHQGDALNIMRGLGDETRLQQALPIATGGEAAADSAIKAQEELVKIQQGDRAAHNEEIIRLFDIEMQKRGYGAFRRGLETKFAGFLSGRGDDLPQTFGRTAEHEKAGEMPGDLYTKTLERFQELHKERDFTGVGPIARPAVPVLPRGPIAGAFQPTAEEKSMLGMKDKVLQLEEALMKLKTEAMSKDSPGGEKVTKHEERKIKLAEQQLSVAKEQLAIAKGKKEQQRAKNGMNLGG